MVYMAVTLGVIFKGFGYIIYLFIFFPSLGLSLTMLLCWNWQFTFLYTPVTAMFTIIHYSSHVITIC